MSTSPVPTRSRASCSRRGFLKTAAAAVCGMPALIPATARGRFAPSNRIHVGLIGCGHQSQRIVPSFLVHDDMQMVAVCDVNRQSDGYYHPGQVLGRETAKRWVEEHYAEKTGSGRFSGCRAYHDYRELLAREDIDAVALIVPDHWHALMAIEAAEAGKDIYCEKPLALTVTEGRKMVRAVREHGRIFQTGAQFRSSPAVRHACELVRNGRLGEIRRVRTWVAGNHFDCPGPDWEPMPVPAGFDYDFWLGSAPEAPYHHDRCLFRFRYILDYSNGQTANFGAHVNDIAQWGLGTDLTSPIDYQDEGSEFLPEGSLFSAAVRTAFRARYADGVELICRTRENTATRFEGTEGQLEVSLGGRLRSYPENLKDSVIGPDEIHLPVANPAHTVHRRSDVDADHVRNFLDAVKSRQDPLEPAEVGHSTGNLCILGNIAQLLKRTIRWDPENEQILEDDQAQQMLSRPMRAPWQI